MNRRVLIIDDDINLLNLYQDFLSPDIPETMPTEAHFSKDNNSRFFTVKTANHGQAGVELARQALDANTPFAVAFIDMRMLPGWDGLKTAEAIRKLDDRIYIVIITGYRDRSIDQIQEVLEHDVFYLAKPSCKEEIYQMARSLCIRWDRDFESHNPTIITNLDKTSVMPEDTSPGIIKISGMTNKAKELLNNKEHFIQNFPFKFGRTRSTINDNMFSDSGFYIQDVVPYSISKNHLLINFYENQYYILDCGSHLGTIVNNEHIGRKTSRYKSILIDGENILIIGNESSPYKFKITLPR
ncbi:MAG: response regulator [Candidatus Marinimicrobia bacterium]|nr:response regulator [Candidatus Neomarinimicrobiota bacterium]